MSSRRYRIKVSTNFPDWPLARQLPGDGKKWGQCDFFINKEIGDCDAWFVVEGLTQAESTICPSENVILLALEPPGIKQYDQKWTRKFGAVIGFQKGIHSQMLSFPAVLPWWVGKNYDDLIVESFPQKTKMVSAIFSSKKTTHGHRQRFHNLNSLLPDSLFTAYGRGFQPLEDKWDGLAPYYYSVVVENSCYPNYWTEKIADCFLSGTVPIYCGCPDILNYFPKESLLLFDISSPDTLRSMIQKQCSPADYASRLTAIREAKRRVLHEYNLFKIMSDITSYLPERKGDSLVTLSPEPPPHYLKRRYTKLRNRLPF
jgi:hypothetical protein